MKTHILREIVLQQSGLEKKLDFLVKRSEFKNLINSLSINIISGVENCGKNTLLHQIMKFSSENYYIDFEDERLLHFTSDDFKMLHEIFIDLFGIETTFYLNQIQNIDSWEIFIESLVKKNFKVYLTISNTNKLSDKFKEVMKGTYAKTLIYPYSFKEYLKYHNYTYYKNYFSTIEKRVLLKKQFNNYYIDGGLPEYVSNKDPEYLKRMYKSILYKDILVRNKLINEKELRKLACFLVSNIGRLITFSSLKKVINIKHTQTVKKYIQYFEDAHLIFLLSKFSHSLNKQRVNPKKVYFIDNALAKSISFDFSNHKGKYLENIVFLELKRLGFDLFYHKEKYHCSFLLKEQNVITQAIQVTVSLNNIVTKENIINGLLEAMKIHQLDNGFILTEEEEDIIDIDQKKIIIIPIYKWLLLKNA